MKSSGFSPKKSSAAPVFLQTMSLIMLMWFALLCITLTVTLRYSLNTLQKKIDEILTSTVVTLAENPAIRDAILSGECPEDIMAYLDNVIDNTEDLDLITIADAESVRIYYIDRGLIGQKFVGGDESRALAGERYLSDATGTTGDQHRAFCPVWDQNGTVIGFVMASATQERIELLRSQIFATYGKLALFLTACSLVVSAVEAVFLNRNLRGARPEDLLRTYLTQNDVLNSLDEGLISLDGQGRIRMVNRAAAQALGRREELLIQQPVDSLLRADGGSSLLGVTGENLPTNHPNILVNSLQVRNPSLWARQVLILKDKSELMRQAEQLGGTRHIISALRANSHEYLNKLQVIAGLLQMGRPEEALAYIGQLSRTHAQAIAPVMQSIHNANVAALLLGKLENTRELDIHPTLLPNSYLPEHSRYLATGELVTVIGNLLENAIEAVNTVAGSNPRTIDLQITEDDSGLLIMVSDSGEGIAPEILPRIYDPGFSTKAAEGRGVGMGLVKHVVDRRGGSIEVDTEPGSGTTFTLIFNQERGGRT